jgi:matrixin
MKRVLTGIIAMLAILTMILDTSARGYSVDTTVAPTGGCPQPDRWNLSLGSPLNNRWSTSLPSSPQTILTVAAPQSNAQAAEIQGVIVQTLGIWSGVAGTTFNASAYPGLIAPLAQVSAADSCTNDQESGVDGLNTICFNQSSAGFTNGVLAFTRVITANAIGVSAGSSGPSAFVGQILDSDTLFRNDGQATFATPGALATPQGQGAYDLETLLTHELGHWFGLGHSAVIRAAMFPFAAPPGTFLGNRPTSQVPDAPLADDDRTGIRSLYPDPGDTLNVGAIRGQILPANPFALAAFPPSSPGSPVTGIFGAHVVAVDSDTGAVLAGVLGGWSCDAASPPAQFDGSYDIERLPVGHNYIIYAEPLIGLVGPSDFSDVLGDPCPSGVDSPCTIPAVNTNFNVRILPASP